MPVRLMAGFARVYITSAISRSDRRKDDPGGTA